MQTYHVTRLLSAVTLTVVCAIVCYGDPPPERLSLLTRGVNMSHWFAQLPESRHLGDAAWKEEHDRPDDFAALAQAGFRHVRLPVEFEQLFDDKNQLRSDRLTWLDQAIGHLSEAGLAIILDWHAQEETKTKLATDDDAVRMAISRWAILAAHFSARDPQRFFFETMNEPGRKIPRDRWYSIQAEMVAAIRKSAPRHTLIVSPARWSGIDELEQMKPLPDTNVVYNVHFYEPMVFTHQGAGWPQMGLEAIAHLAYPAEPRSLDVNLKRVGNGSAKPYLDSYTANAAWIIHRIETAAAWAQRYKVTLTCNEFGVYSRNADESDRCRWIADVRRALEQNAIGWSMWDYAGGFGVAVSAKTGPHRHNPAVVAALGLGTKKPAHDAPGSPQL